MVLTSTLLCFLIFTLGLASPIAGPQHDHGHGTVDPKPTVPVASPTKPVRPTATVRPTPPALPTTVPGTHKPPHGVPPKPPKCRYISKRKAWQALTLRERKKYIEAELCLMKKPAKTGLEGAINRFDDLIKPHQLQGLRVHNTGYFLPFHRILMHAHEVLLRTECGYKGYQPYWAEEVDVDKIEQSEVLDPVTGFGGGGGPPDSCITDGPFKNYVLNTGPGFENVPHCIRRRLSNIPTGGAKEAYVKHCYQFETFLDAWQCIESSGPHNSFHGGVGGEMSNPLSSPGDPVFYLHHSWLDKVWWDWQKQKSERLTDVSGRKDGFLPGFGGTPPPGLFPNGTFPTLPGNGTFPPGGGFSGNFTFPGFNFNRPPTWKPTPEPPEKDPVMLDDVLNMFGVIPNATVRDVMDIKGGYMCYDYVDYKAPTPKEKRGWISSLTRRLAGMN